MTKEDEKSLGELFDKVIDGILWTKICKAWVRVESEKTKEFYEYIRKKRNPSFYDMIVDKIFKRPQLLITYKN